MAAGNFDINDLKRRMEGAINSLKHELGGLRTGVVNVLVVDLPLAQAVLQRGAAG